MTSAKLHYIASIDGGGTNCRIRLYNLDGGILAEAQQGSANIYQDAALAQHNIVAGVSACLSDIGVDDLTTVYVCAGLAGADVASCVEAFRSWVHPFGRLDVESDAFMACIGAHNCQPGALAVVGTGVAGVAITPTQTYCLSGWGFPLADLGGGAWLGQRLLQESLNSVDGLRASCRLTERVLQHFITADAITEWAAAAKSGDYGFFARWIIEAQKAKNALAQQLIEEQVQHLSPLFVRLIELSQAELVITGGLAPFIIPMLDESIAQKLSQACFDTQQGAYLYAKEKCHD